MPPTKKHVRRLLRPLNKRLRPLQGLVDWHAGRYTAATDAALRARTAWTVTADQPLLLISQVQRSGGTLLLRLFDDHAGCFVHPYDVNWGFPEKIDWQELDVTASPAALFEQLAGGDKWVFKAMRELRYVKGSDRTDGHPFVFSHALQRQVFESFRAARPAQRPRDIFDAYFTSFFTAWLDYQALYRGPKQYVVAYTPRLILNPTRRIRFWTDYPDGYLLSIVRDPLSWYLSTRRYRPKWRDRPPHELFAIWRASLESTLAAHAERPDRAIVVLFEDLVLRTPAVMRRLADATGLPFDDVLLRPTFNGRPVRSNSCFGPRVGIDVSAANRADAAAPGEIVTVDAGSLDAYARARDRFGVAGSIP